MSQQQSLRNSQSVSRTSPPHTSGVYRWDRHSTASGAEDHSAMSTGVKRPREDEERPSSSCNGSKSGRARKRARAPEFDEKYTPPRFRNVVELPMDVLFEILQWVHPAGVLGLTRSCRAFYRLLTGRGDSYLIWRSSFDLHIYWLPLLSREAWLSFPALARIVFDATCEGCGQTQADGQICWQLKTRLCQNCRLLNCYQRRTAEVGVVADALAWEFWLGESFNDRREDIILSLKRISANWGPFVDWIPRSPLWTEFEADGFVKQMCPLSEDASEVRQRMDPLLRRLFLEYERVHGWPIFTARIRSFCGKVSIVEAIDRKFAQHWLSPAEICLLPEVRQVLAEPSPDGPSEDTMVALIIDLTDLCWERREEYFDILIHHLQDTDGGLPVADPSLQLGSTILQCRSCEEALLPGDVLAHSCALTCPPAQPCLCDHWETLVRSVLGARQWKPHVFRWHPHASLAAGVLHSLGFDPDITTITDLEYCTPQMSCDPCALQGGYAEMTTSRVLTHAIQYHADSDEHPTFSIVDD